MVMFTSWTTQQYATSHKHPFAFIQGNGSRRHCSHKLLGMTTPCHSTLRTVSVLSWKWCSYAGASRTWRESRRICTNLSAPTHRHPKALPPLVAIHPHTWWDHGCHSSVWCLHQSRRILQANRKIKTSSQRGGQSRDAIWIPFSAQTQEGGRSRQEVRNTLHKWESNDDLCNRKIDPTLWKLED